MIVLVAVAALYVINTRQFQGSTIATGNTSGTSTTVIGGSRTRVSVEEFGPITTIENARNLVGANFGLPTKLPSNLTLGEIRASPKLVALVFLSSSLPSLSPYNRGNLIIIIANDSTSYTYTPSSGPGIVRTIIGGNVTSTIVSSFTLSGIGPTATEVLVSGHPGWGFDPAGQDGFGEVNWWSNGIHYIMIANLPLATLVDIAGSMNT